jgi:hypothetical protein
MEPAVVKSAGPTMVSVANDPGAASWVPKTPPLGTFNMTVVEGKDLAVKDSNGTSTIARRDPSATGTGFFRNGKDALKLHADHVNRID